MIYRAWTRDALERRGLVFVLLGCLALAAAGCFPMPQEPATADEASVLSEAGVECPCPDLAAASLGWWPPDDPDAPAPCSVKSRTNLWMPAQEHPACRAEAARRSLK